MSDVSARSDAGTSRSAILGHGRRCLSLLVGRRTSQTEPARPLVRVAARSARGAGECPRGARTSNIRGGAGGCTALRSWVVGGSAERGERDEPSATPGERLKLQPATNLKSNFFTLQHTPPTHTTPPTQLHQRYVLIKTPNPSLLSPPQNKITRPTPLAPHVLGTLSVSPLISLPRPQPHDPTPSAPSASVHRDVSVSQTRAELTRRRWRGQSRTCSPSSCG